MTAFTLQYATEINNGPLYKVKAEHLVGNFNALKSDIDDRLSTLIGGVETVESTVTFTQPISGIDGSDPSHLVTFGRLTSALTNSSLGYRPKHIAGRYYPAEHTNSIAAGSAGQGIGTATSTVTVPFYVGMTASFDRIGVYCSASTAASTVRLGIYSSAATGKPGVLLVDGGTVATTSTGIKEATISQSLDPGWYWLAVRVNSTSVGLSYQNIRDFDIAKVFGVGSIPTTTLTSVVSGGAYEDTANFPASYTASPTLVPASPTTAVPAVFLRAS